MTGEDPHLDQPSPAFGTVARTTGLSGELLAPTETWRPGDVVMDADGRLWWRAGPDSIDKGWPWGYIDGYAPPDPQRPEMVPTPDGSVAETDPTRPLRLLIRAGNLVPD